MYHIYLVCVENVFLQEVSQGVLLTNELVWCGVSCNAGVVVKPDP